MARLAVAAALACCVLLVASATASAANSAEFDTPAVQFMQTKRGSTALYDYVSKPDAAQSWFDTGHRIEDAGLGWKAYTLNTTSQIWLSEKETTCSKWTHQLAVIVPDGQLADASHAAMYVTGRHNGDEPPTAKSIDIVAASIIALRSRIVTAVLFQIPNQSCRFTVDPEERNRSEDALVALTWKQYVDNPDKPEWVVYLPMVKAVMHAIQVVQEFAPTVSRTKISRWFVAGASKRGATTWLAGAYSGSLGTKGPIRAIIPIVFDMLNFTHSVPHMYEAYNGWTFAFKTYWEQNITTYVNTPEMHRLAAVVDPLSYPELANVHKYVITATGDEFFMPDDDWFWWDSLPGPKRRLMIHNAEHSTITGLHILLDGVTTYISGLLESESRVPEPRWNIDKRDGTLTMRSAVRPQAVYLHSAVTVPSTPYRRDFRMIKGIGPSAPCDPPAVKIDEELCFNPIFWNSALIEPIEVSAQGYKYRFEAEAPQEGWLAFMMEVHYPGPRNIQGNSTFHFTTQVSIVPRQYPFEPCGSGEECRGELV